MNERDRARRGLLIYFAIVITVSGIIEYCLIRAGDSIRNHLWLVLGLMWTPALASVVARLLLREGGPNLMEMPEPELYARACDHRWTFACGGSKGDEGKDPARISGVAP